MPPSGLERLPPSKTLCYLYLRKIDIPSTNRMGHQDMQAPLPYQGMVHDRDLIYIFMVT